MQENDKLGLLSRGLSHEKVAVERAEVPDDVKDILSRVAERRGLPSRKPSPTGAMTEAASRLGIDERLAALDQL